MEIFVTKIKGKEVHGNYTTLCVYSGLSMDTETEKCSNLVVLPYEGKTCDSPRVTSFRAEYKPKYGNIETVCLDGCAYGNSAYFNNNPPEYAVKVRDTYVVLGSQCIVSQNVPGLVKDCTLTPNCVSKVDQYIPYLHGTSIEADIYNVASLLILAGVTTAIFSVASAYLAKFIFRARLANRGL